MPTDDLLACVVDGVLPAVADRPEQPILIVDGEFGSAVGRSALVAEWSTGAVLRIALAADGSGTSVSPFLRGLESPVPVLAHGSDLFVGDWATGKLYRISA